MGYVCGGFASLPSLVTPIGRRCSDGISLH